jgi:hypothetical protein
MTASTLTTQYGLAVSPEIAFYDEDSGFIVGADCLRLTDRHIRFYRADQLRAKGGATEVQAVLESAPIKESTNSPRYNQSDL